MTDFVVFPQPQVKELKLKKKRKRVFKSPRSFKELGILLLKIILFQDGFFIGYELFSIQDRKTYLLSLVVLLLLLAATFKLILIFIKTEDKLPVFSPSAEEVVPPELVFGFIGTIPLFVIQVVNPILSEVIKYGIYTCSCTIMLFSLSFKSTQNTQILTTILYLLTVGLSIGMIFQVLHG